MAKSLADILRAAREQINEISGDALEALLLSDRNDVLIVDVLDVEEYQKNRLPGAIHAPRSHIEELADLEYGHRHPELSAARERMVILYCRSGSRSALATVALQEMGFQNIHSLAGGITVWDADDKPVIFG